MKKKLIAFFAVVGTLWCSLATGASTLPAVTATRSQYTERYLPSFTLTDGSSSQLYTVGQTSGSTTAYFDISAATPLEVSAGATLSFSSLPWNGAWMHCYLYIDYDKSGSLNSTLNANGSGTGELVSYSYYSGTNSLGASASESGGVTAAGMPAFTLPQTLEAGDYTVRVKIDWNDITPEGSQVYNGGTVADFVIKVRSNVSRTVTVKTADASRGSVAIEGTAETSVTTASAVKVVATPLKNNSFVNWTDEASSAVVSTLPAYTYSGSENITMVANFSDLTYPVMTRTFTNNANQENRYIAKVTSSGTQTPTVFEATTQEELPYTAFSLSAGTYTAAGACIDKTGTPIEIEQGATSFSMTYFGWQDNIGSYGKQIDWTQEATYVDWNLNGSFIDEGEYSAKSSDNSQNTALYATGGYTRTVAVPAGVEAGTYRMRVVFFEPSSYTENWVTSLFTSKNNQIRNGVSYDFLVKVLDPAGMELKNVSVDKPVSKVNAGDANVKIATVKLTTTGSLNPLALSQIKVKYTGTATGDINNLRWTLAANGNATDNVVANAATAQSDMTFDVASASLAQGDNYLTLIADVASAAAVGNIIKVAVESVTIAGTVTDIETAPGEGELTVSQIVDYTKGNALWFDTATSSSLGAAWNTNDFSSTDTNPDQVWERQSFPIGNGSFGGNVLGSVSRERVVLNEKTLWKGGPGTGASTYWNMNKTVTASTLASIRSYLLNGANSSAASMVSNNYAGNVNYSRNVFGTYTTMGEAYVSTGINESEVSGYKRIMNMDSSLVVVQFAAAGVNYQRKYFCSYPDSVMVWRYTSDGGSQNLSFTFNCPQIVKSKTAVDGGILYSCSLDNNGMDWAMRVLARVNGTGTVAVDATAGTITVTGANDVEFILAADTDYKMNFDPDMNDARAFVGVDPVASVNKNVDAAKELTYDELYGRHRQDYANLFNRVELAINPSQTFENLPTPTRLSNYRNGTLDHGLEQLYFQYGRYLLIACSRAGNMPANLQGMWHNNTDGPWRVDYHNNINLQMNYWPATCTNLLECFQPFIDYVKGLVAPGARTAQSYYQARGWTAEVSTNIFGFTAPLNSTDMSWNYNPTAGPWLATQIWEYYDYTRDKEWLRETGYDIIKNSANFCADLLFSANGTYTSAPSYSPEHGTCDLGATYANAVTREILADAIKSAEILDVDATLVAEWKGKLNAMYPYQIGRYGQLQEWYNDIDTYNDTHRHTNHLFGLHPGSTINPITTPALAEACKETLRQRGDAATGWSMGWKLNHWARLQDGDHAYTLFQNLIKNGTADNMFDLHPPFQIDGNFGGTAGVSELFLQSQMDSLYVLPALPSSWTDGHIKGLLTRGNFTVNIFYRGGKLDYMEITSNKGEECNLRYNAATAKPTMSFETSAGETYIVRYDDASKSLVRDMTQVDEITSQAATSRMTVYPNPNKGHFTVRLDGETRGDVEIGIYNLIGQKVKELKVVKEGEYLEIPVDCDAVQGYYLVKASGKSLDASSKFVIE